MQPNLITLPVDLLNNDTTTDLDLTRFEEYVNRSVYVTDNHMISARDTLGLYRTFPKQSGNFLGVQKTCVKFTRDYVVDGADGVTTVKAPCIVEVSFSVPVGMSDADILIMRQRAVALLDDDSVMVPLNSQLMI
jgi:hypothetical protein